MPKSIRKNPNPIDPSANPMIEPDCLGCGSLNLTFKGKQLGEGDNNYYWIYDCYDCGRENPVETQLGDLDLDLKCKNCNKN